MSKIILSSVKFSAGCKSFFIRNSDIIGHVHDKVLEQLCGHPVKLDERRGDVVNLLR